MENWLNENLKEEVRKIFEPRYDKLLDDEEVKIIANNLTEFMEHFLRMKWRVYENKQD